MRLRNRVRQVREERGISLRRLARLAHTTRVTLRLVEADDSHPVTDRVKLGIAEALNMDPAALFWYERQPVEEPEAVAS